MSQSKRKAILEDLLSPRRFFTTEARKHGGAFDSARKLNIGSRVFCCDVRGVAGASVLRCLRGKSAFGCGGTPRWALCTEMWSRAVIGFICIFCDILGSFARPAFSAEADPDDPETELRSFKVADGYEVHLFASEKDGIVKPVQMRWDPQGRLWVSCIPSYPQLKPGEKPDDRVVILADTDGGGAANYSSVFVRGLDMPLGLELGHGGLYVASGNDLLFMKEANGSGKADETRIVLRGFFTGDAHQNINSFAWGPGGELMFCQGLHAFSHIETPYGNETLLKAGIWRLRPRTLRLESFLGNDRGPQNPWGIVFDDWGQPIMAAGNGQGIYYLLPSLIHTDHFLDPKQIWTRSGIKLCGVDIIGTKAMPASAQGMMVAGSILDNNVYLLKGDWNATNKDRVSVRFNSWSNSIS